MIRQCPRKRNWQGMKDLIESKQEGEKGHKNNNNKRSSCSLCSFYMLRGGVFLKGKLCGRGRSLFLLFLKQQCVHKTWHRPSSSPPSSSLFSVSFLDAVRKELRGAKAPFFLSHFKCYIMQRITVYPRGGGEQEKEK